MEETLPTDSERVSELVVCLRVSFWREDEEEEVKDLRYVIYPYDSESHLDIDFNQPRRSSLY